MQTDTGQYRSLVSKEKEAERFEARKELKTFDLKVLVMHQIKHDKSHVAPAMKPQ